ncbi:hypothetical protein KUCAC02_009845 [Chaenocephalus aceratus]|uniref:Uncharacterized protein n=1 Tax=Chaenocephalus aceratus TaxID=36190 RepID=A0ACB9VYT0_CHAAC|nr:hypothetical protein KUCAC02_009845 [Chaenocephalus aceratus]
MRRNIMFRALEPQHVEEHWIVGSQCEEDAEKALLIAAPIEWEWRGEDGMAPCSPDLTWAAVRVTDTTTLADLGHMLVEEWDAIPQQSVSRLVTARGGQAVVAVFGSSTRY